MKHILYDEQGNFLMLASLPTIVKVLGCHQEAEERVNMDLKEQNNSTIHLNGRKCSLGYGPFTIKYQDY